MEDMNEAYEDIRQRLAMVEERLGMAGRAENPKPEEDSLSNPPSLAPKISPFASNSTTAIRVNAMKPNPQRSFRKSFIENLSEEVINRLDFGYLAYLYIDDPRGVPFKLQARKVMISALCAISPAINATVNHNGEHEQTDHIALPPGDKMAYQHILTWLNRVVLIGRVCEMHIITHEPLLAYHKILDVATKLGISVLVRDLTRRIESMLTHEPGKFYVIRLHEIRKTYLEPKVYQNLKAPIINNLAKAWMAGDITLGSRRSLKTLFKDIPEFWNDLEPKRRERGWNGREITM